MNSQDDTPSIPNDGTTLTDVLEAYSSAGFTGSFSAIVGTAVECHECGTVSAAATVEMTSLRRLEGASDPDDMLAVVAIACPTCSSKGTLILGFGPNAAAEEGDALRALQDLRDNGSLPRNSAPGEAVGDVSSESAHR